MLIRRITAAAVGFALLGALALGLVFPHPAAAQSTPPAVGSLVRAAGKITALQTGGFTLTARNNQVYNVAVGADTWIVVKKNNRPVQGALADLQVGENVNIAGTATGNNGVAARVVSQGNLAVTGRPPAGRRPAARPGQNHPAVAAGRLGKATVQSVANGTVTLDQGAGRTRTVNTDAGTLVIRDGKLGSVADLKTGDSAVVLARPQARPAGRPATRPAPTAAAIYVPAANDQFTLGVVKSVSGNAAVLRTGRGQQTVTVASSTTFKTIAGAGQAPTTAAQSDLKAGTRVLVYSVKPAAGQIATASIVLILPQGKVSFEGLTF